GIYQDFIHKRNIQLPFSVGAEVESEQIKSAPILRVVLGVNHANITLKYDYDNTTSQARLLQIKAIFKHASDHQKDLTWTLNRQTTRKSYNLAISRDMLEIITSRYKFQLKKPIEPEDKLTLQNSERLHFKPTSSSPESPCGLAAALVNQTLSTLTNYIEKNVFYLGPLRSSPSRSYIRSSHSLAVGVRGEYTPSVLANLEKRSKKVTRGESENVVNSIAFERWLEKIFPGHFANTKTIEELVKLKISNKQTLNYSSNEKSDTITDVGFGFSQVFPIIVQAAVMPSDSTLIIEQPELHLHPLAQTRLADVITDAASQGKKFIIETHSEHFIRGLQLAISEHRLNKKRGTSKENIKIYYIKNSPKTHETLELNEFGEFIKEWPSGFFDESYKTMQKL